MGDADTGNDHLSDVDLPSQSALASLAEQPGDAAAKPRPKAAKLLKEKNSDSLPFVCIPQITSVCHADDKVCHVVTHLFINPTKFVLI